MHGHASLFNNLSMVNAIFFCILERIRAHILSLLWRLLHVSAGGQISSSDTFAQEIFGTICRCEGRTGRTPRKEEPDWRPTRVLNANLDHYANANLTPTHLLASQQ